MTTLVVGATGATGKHLVEQLLNMGHHVKAMVRPSAIIPDAWNNNDKLSIIKANISKANPREMAHHVKGCRAIASCLGHNPTFTGIFGKPRKLVTDTVELLCAAVSANSPEHPVRFVLMNTAGNSNRDLDEPVPVSQKLLMVLIRLLIPPQSDNEKASDFLRLQIGQKNASIEWVAVRPDALINQDKVTEYEVFVSPARSALFNPGKTSRINVGHFMARLVTENKLWDQWKGQMPVIYNRTV
jgi:putative NADH-flavin reductase